MYQAGELNQRINIKRRTQTADGHGGFTESFADYKTGVPAKLRRKSEKEKRDFDRNNPQSTVKFVIHNRTDLLHNDTVEHNGIEYNIINIPPYNSFDLYLELECESGVAV